MGFKLFLEEIGLADMGRNIDRLFNTTQFANQTGAMVSTIQTYDHPQGYAGDVLGFPRMPAPTFIMPSVERTGKIDILLLKKNPIYIRLTDGTELYLTYDQYNRIEGKPSLGKTMTVIFQRHPEDYSGNYSQVKKIIVRE